MNVTVVALGKIGLPLAVQFASKGHRVIGADINPETVALVNEGVEPFPGEAHLGEKLADAVGAGLLSATTDTAAAVAQSDAVVLVVPLFVDAAGVPDFAPIDAATRDVARGLQQRFSEDQGVAQEITLAAWRARPLIDRMSDALHRPWESYF